MTLEADQAVQEARFAGACQDQHAGRPAPSLGLAKGNQSCNKPKQVSFLERKSIKVTGPDPSFQELGAQGVGPGPQGLGGGASRALGPGPGAQASPAFLGCKGEKRGFSPSPLLKPSNTPCKVGRLSIIVTITGWGVPLI